MKKILAGLLVAALCTGLFCACTPQTDPTDTDSSVQASTDSQTNVTSSETDSATDASTNSSSDANTVSTDLTTDASTGTETNTETPAAPTPFPFADTVHGFDWEALGYTIPVKDTYEFFDPESYDSSAYDGLRDRFIKYFKGKATFLAERSSLGGVAKQATYEPLPGKEKISLSLPGVNETIVCDYRSTSKSGRLDSPYKAIQRIGSLDHYAGRTSQNTSISLSIQRETGLITWLFFTNKPRSWYDGEKEITQAEAEAMAHRLLEQYYGKEALTYYTHVRTSFIKESLGQENDTYCVVYQRMLGEYPTNEKVRLYVTKYGYFTGISSFNVGLYPDLEKTLTVERVDKTKQDVLDAVPDDIMCYLWTIERDINGEYYLSFFCENRENWFEYDLTINIK